MECVAQTSQDTGQNHPGLRSTNLFRNCRKVLLLGTDRMACCNRPAKFFHSEHIRVQPQRLPQSFHGLREQSGKA